MVDQQLRVDLGAQTDYFRYQPVQLEMVCQEI